MSGIKEIIISAALAAAVSASAQDHIESFSHNKNFRGADRTMQYAPTPDGYITAHNGKNLYTRALYGGHSLWRLETSDTPIFAAYHKKDNRNIHFTLTLGDRKVRLDSVDCVAKYRGGERVYVLTDYPAWDKGSITLTALAAHDDEAAYWKAEARNMPEGSILTIRSCPTVKIKLNRSGDMGADPANCFAPDLSATEGVSESSINIGGKDKVVYARYADRDVTFDDQKKLKALYEKTEKDTDTLRNRLKIATPDPYINTLGATLAAAGDGIWDGLTYQHGAVGWRMPLSGWRGAYTGDFLGWHDRARTHFDAYSESQVTDVLPTIPHPAQDSTMNMARARKEWGTQMYSNGYICRSPQKNNAMHHYDMNLCYIDELLWHLQWTGDTAYARQIWPVIERSLEWEKRNYDPDDDGLYDAYCCIWASDALYYNSGAVTHSSAYNYRANRLAEQVAEIIGVDPTPYREEADKILSAMNSTLWMDDKGTWAEFKDRMGNGHLHTHPGLWTIYHAIDGGTGSPEQAYRATRYIDANIPHITVDANGLDDGMRYEVISTTDWMPYAWSINNVAFAEIYNTAMAYWQAGRADEAYRLMKSAMLDGMFIGNSPGNIGQISHYDAARGECYRDFADPVGVLSRAVVEGLFGFSPELLSRRITLRPGFPSDWGHAAIEHPDFKLIFMSAGGTKDLYILQMNDEMAMKADSLQLILPVKYEDEEVWINGKEVEHTITDKGKPYQALVAKAAVNYSDKLDIEVRHSGAMAEVEDTPAQRFHDIPSPLGVEPVDGISHPLDISAGLNDNVTAIFRNRYESPRSPYTTLQLPVNGIGEWCHPKDSAYIDDSYLRGDDITIDREILGTAHDLHFNVASTEKNIAYMSLYDNYPDSIVIPVEGSGRALALLMAGSTNHMQAYTSNATLEVHYTDGSAQTLSLVPPYNWSPIEQDYFTDGKAFSIPTSRQLRMKLTDGTVSRDLGKATGIEGVYGRRIEGGASNLLFVPLDESKQLHDITLKADANEVVIGLIAASIIKD